VNVRGATSDIYEPGDPVTITCGCDIEALGVVAAVGKLKVLLEDGSAWRSRDGERWGGSTSILSARLRRRKSGDEEAYRRRRAIAGFHRIRPADLPIGVLEQIVALARTEDA
jgi:hypothetical protein